MTVLFLHRTNLQPFPYDRWLADYDGGVVLLAARDKIELFGEEAQWTPIPGTLGYRTIELLPTPFTPRCSTPCWCSAR